MKETRKVGVPALQEALAEMVATTKFRCTPSYKVVKSNLAALEAAALSIKVAHLKFNPKTDEREKRYPRY
jgi:hypothetical protein